MLVRNTIQISIPDISLFYALSYGMESTKEKEKKWNDANF